MPDFTMCLDNAYMHRKTCRRHEESGTQASDFRQSYFVGTPRKGMVCSYFSPIERKDPMPNTLVDSLFATIEHYQSEPEEPEIGKWEDGYKAAVRDMSMALLTFLEEEDKERFSSLVNRVAGRL